MEYPARISRTLLREQRRERNAEIRRATINEEKDKMENPKAKYFTGLRYFRCLLL